MSTADIQDRSTFHQGGRTGILLIHGLGGTPVELRFVAQGLARAGFTVYCCQLAGHCGSFEDLRESTWQDWYKSVEAAHDRLKETCDVVLAGGLSTGAILALHLAYKRPADVHGLTLFSPSLRADGWAMPWYNFLLQYIRPSWLKVDITLSERAPYGLKDERIRAMVVQSMQSGDSTQAGLFTTPLRTFAHFNALVAVVRPQLASITTPTLILHPREDDIASLNNALKIQEKMSGLVELVVLEDSYHIITLDKQRHVVVDRAAQFARSIENKRTTAANQSSRVQRRLGG